MRQDGEFHQSVTVDTVLDFCSCRDFRETVTRNRQLIASARISIRDAVEQGSYPSCVHLLTAAWMQMYRQEYFIVRDTGTIEGGDF